MYLDTMEMLVRQSFYIFIMLLEIYGAIVIFLAANSIFFSFIRPRNQSDHKQRAIRLAFARHLALGLEFLLGSEIIRTVVVRSWSELSVLMIVLIMRAFLALLVMWEIKQEQKIQPD